MSLLASPEAPLQEIEASSVAFGVPKSYQY